MNNRLFLIFCLVLVFGLQVSFFALKAELDGSEILKAELALLKRDLEIEKARTQVAEFQLESYKQVVAVHLPEKVNQQNYNVRGLASHTRKVASEKLSYNKIEIELNKIKEQFLKMEYAAVVKKLEKFLNSYVDFPEIHEAYFLYVSSLYELKQYEKTLTVVDIMVESFPENELTGFALLLTAEVFVKQERPEDARQVLETVIQSFQFPEIKNRAIKRLKELEI